MKLTRNIFLATIIIFSAIITVSAAEKQSAVIESISYESDGAHGETVNFKLNGIHIPKIFAIKGEKPRVVFDFLDTKYSDLINSIIETEGNLVKRVRVGIHNEPVPKTRVVIDLAPSSDFTYEQDFITQDNILTISIFNPQEEKVDSSIDPKVVPAPQKEAMVTAEPVSPVETIKIQKEKTKRLFAVTEEVAAVETETVAAIEPQYPSAEDVFKPEEKKKKDIEAVQPAELETTAKPVNVTGPTLLDVSFDGSSNKGEMVMFKLNDFYPPIVFGIEKENPRVVCDFLDTQLADNVELEINSKGVYVDQIRTAKHHDPDKIRVVLDLLPNKNYDLQQVFFKEDNLFVIIVNSFNEPIEKSKESVQ